MAIWSLCFHLFKNMFFPCLFKKESITAGNTITFSRGLKQMEVCGGFRIESMDSDQLPVCAL